jgi:type II secretory pathway pseudopilin PulG
MLKSSNHGSTLIEIIMAILIFGIITVPLLRAFLVSANSSKKSVEVSEATVAAQSLIERISAADIDELLKNSEVLSKGARFCEISNGAYTELETATQKHLKGIYHLYVPEISGGTREFDALVTLSADNKDNEETIGIYSEIDTMIIMRGYDSIAERAYIAQCTPKAQEDGPGPILTINDLSRGITISALRQSDDYEITVTMHYENSAYGFSQDYSESAFIRGVKDTDSDKAVFSLFLIYDAYYKDGTYTEDISIKNDYWQELDFNVFLVNTSEDTANYKTNYTASINYKNQHFDKNGKTQPRVFTNLPSDAVSYWAHSDHASVPLPVSGYLVEERAKDRRYLISVDLYRQGEGPKEKPVFSLDSQRLY